MKIAWYIGNDEPDSSLNVIFSGLKKHSSFDYIKATHNIDSLIKSDVNVVIGSYRYYQARLNDMIERFGSNCFCFIHGFSVRGKDATSFIAEKYGRLSSKGVKFLVSSSYSHKHLVKYGLDGYVLPFGVELSDFPFKQKIKKKPVFGMCYQNRKAHRKGADVLKLINKLGYDTKVATSIPHNELYKFFQTIDCLIVASEDDGRETFCLPIIEAAACGTPTISTNVGCASDFIRNRENGFLVRDKFDILSVISKCDDFVTLGEEARRTVETADWSWKDMATIWDETLSELCYE